MTDSSIPDKSTLRRHMRLRRRELTRAQRAQAARGFLRYGQRLLRRARCIAFFAGFDGEPELEALWQWALRQRKTVLLPSLCAPAAAMCFRQLRPSGVLRKNHYGIREPVTGRRFRLAEIDVLLMPLTAFDNALNRLGMGAGYYDRLLAQRAKQGLRRPQRIGVAYRWQQVEHLPVEAWDVPLHALLHERGCWRQRAPKRS